MMAIAKGRVFHWWGPKRKIKTISLFKKGMILATLNHHLIDKKYNKYSKRKISSKERRSRKNLKNLNPSPNQSK
jgi:hypothetical protein